MNVTCTNATCENKGVTITIEATDGPVYCGPCGELLSEGKKS